MIKKLYDSSYLDTLQVYFDRTKQHSYKLLDPRPGDVLVDIGCGNGDDALVLAQSGATVIGVDHDPLYVAIANAKDKPENISFICSEAHDLPLESGSVDKVHFERVFQHLPDHPAVMKEVARILKPGGQVQITDSDFLSISFFIEDKELERKVVDAIAFTMVPNAYKVRQIPYLLPGFGFKVLSFEVHNYLMDDYAFADYVIRIDGIVKGLVEKGIVSAKEFETWEKHKAGHFKMSFNVLIYNVVKE
jgi:ubiquinone/menaquinone biosynthesis C-methylase UbiE